MTPDEHPHSPCYDDLRFISTNPRDVAEAITICAGCTDRACKPILAEILTRPTDRAVVEGVWDGTYYSAGVTARLDKARAMTHGTPHGARVHRRRGEPPCDDCQDAQAAERQRQRVARKTEANNLTNDRNIA
jgi:hypothetical protein